MSEDDSMDDWAAAMAEQADAEGEGEEGPDMGASELDVQVAELDELQEDRPITEDEQRKLDTILDIPVTISMEVGRSQISIRNLLQLNQGSVVELDRVAGEPLDVLVNGTLIAHGEVVVVNDKFGIRLTDVISQIERIKKLR
ncbi:flagellar motor switch protein FliN [Aestuariibacter sp. AA17]|uniref:Flagellar motor switch protein FliN n=1 Tax=Fluctibacter corallii TaxID=2984329 RepID=A0ABT3A9Y6_9ALTE|nr:flagellar motor switch protein FliN [Aestuariibacter sp. AA17]MCV2885414.1 flagellar motor switch protein FliN [Aestuariibacter sp. AA17]